MKALEVAEALKPRWGAGGVVQGCVPPWRSQQALVEWPGTRSLQPPLRGRAPSKQMLSDEAEPRALQGLPGDGREHLPRALFWGGRSQCCVFAGTGLAYFLLPCSKNAWT